MPRHPTFPDCLDECKQVTITGLKRLGYLRSNSVVSGVYSWTRGGTPSGSISIIVNLIDRIVELDYLYGEEPTNYRVGLVSVKKHFGGYEWYFVCPQTQKRCRTLYGIGRYFLSRSAFPLAMYSSQTESKLSRNLLSAFKYLDLESEHRKKPFARIMYKGKLTRRFNRILDKQQRTDFSGLLQLFNR